VQARQGEVLAGGDQQQATGRGDERGDLGGARRVVHEQQGVLVVQHGAVQSAQFGLTFGLGFGMVGMDDVGHRLSGG
jgi:hypothetical protein